jgi:hypothetical protein
MSNENAENYEFHDFIRVLAHSDPWTEAIELLLVHHLHGRRTLCTQLQFTEVPEGQFTGPTLRLSRYEAQRLMDQLWACGLRPTESKASVGALDATAKHLEDMRTIAFRSLDINEEMERRCIEAYERGDRTTLQDVIDELRKQSPSA